MFVEPTLPCISAGIFSSCTIYMSLVVITFLFLGYLGAPLCLWSIFFAAVAFLSFEPSVNFWVLYAVLNLVFLVRPLRSRLITTVIAKILKSLNVLPKISETEEIALRAGNVWIEEELFSGKPNFKRIFKEPYSQLSKEENEFINNQVEKVCELTDDWQVYSDRDLSKEVWSYLKKERFFGMIIPKEYGGLGFSALAHSEVVAKLATRSQVLAITTMVPNSLGPAELLLHYGTDKQRKYYLPRLADGREIPCFGLTEPTAGSDATSIKAEGIVFANKKGETKIKLNFEKRYITLGAVATVIGLAFNLRDPENLLGKGEEIGITCALLDSKTKGLVLGRRHDPLNVPFVNSPITGKNVEIGLDDIIGGKEQVGQGWKMLMECLSVGRGISLPATSTGGSKLVARATGNYASIRKQFGTPIGKFEGIIEVLARIAAKTYMLDAARIFTASAIDNGFKPAVTNAICKYHFTEMFRENINDGMDIQGGMGIIRGRRNILAHAYMGAPIAITVEGANIMTRSLIHFGQGAIRCHPYSYQEMKALMEGDIRKFDLYFFKHIGHLFRNKFRSILLSVTRGRLYKPFGSDVVSKAVRKIAWCSASFAFFADLALARYGGGIKRKEMLSGRFGDILSWMYLITASLKRYEHEGRRKEDKIFLEWICAYGFVQIDKAFIGIFNNFSGGVLGWILRNLGVFYARLNSKANLPADELNKRLAEILLIDSEQRDRLTSSVYLPKDEGEIMAKLETVNKLLQNAKVPEQKVKDAVRKGLLSKKDPNILKAALEKKILSDKEFKMLNNLEKQVLDVVSVDAYSLSDYASHKMKKSV